MFLFYTDEGLRAKVHYIEENGLWKIYAAGNRRYGLAAFVLFQFMNQGRIPEIAEFGTPADLKYDYDFDRNS